MEPDSVPSKPSDITGIGPIRLRALNKAGFTTLSGIKKAGVEGLSNVRGITSIKAEQIIEFLRPYSLESLQAAEEMPPEPELKPVSIEQWAGAGPHYEVVPIVAESARAMYAVIRLLSTYQGAQLRNRLVDSVNLFAQECQALIIESASIGAAEAEKQLRRLRRISDSIVSASKQQSIDRKEQGRLADDIYEMTEVLATLRLTAVALPKKVARDSKNV